MRIWRGRVLWRGYIHPHPHPHTQLKKSGIPRQNGNGFGQYPRGQVCLPSLITIVIIEHKTENYSFAWKNYYFFNILEVNYY